MGLKETFQGVAATVFSAFGNIPTTVTYVVKNDTYVPGSGPTEDDTEYPDTEGFLLNYEAEEVDNKAVFITDRRLIVEAQKIDFVPKMDDEVIINNQTWQVIGHYNDPTDAIWDIQLRLPS